MREVGARLGISEDAVKTYERAIAQAKADGGRILIGGRRLTEGELAYGYFVEPTIIDGLPTGHPLFSEELFVPVTVIGDVMTLDEAIDLANSTEYGLTAGIFSEDDREIEHFFNRIQAGVTYANRRAGATTGAWPGVQPFGGWKASGTNGKSGGGPYYLHQYVREQSRTIVTWRVRCVFGCQRRMLICTASSVTRSGTDCGVPATLQAA